MSNLKNAEQKFNTIPNTANEDRVDINDIQIDKDLSVVERAEQYIKQIKNPYVFRCGRLAVNVVFSRSGLTLENALSSYLISLAKKE
ncbi:hypothetical protein FACS1894211_15960 [Clostridia bacterium]|nr:hypothetical protein FACS1894211_15960 [Clostridia bacterium]